MKFTSIAIIISSIGANVILVEYLTKSTVLILKIFMDGNDMTLFKRAISHFKQLNLTELSRG